MITKDALAEYKTYDDPYQVEKDYLQDLLLYNIYANSSSTTKDLANAGIPKGKITARPGT